MTARTTKATRVNSHPARKARQLAGLTSGLAYAGATIGIGVAAAGGSDSVDTSSLEGETVAGQVVDDAVPDGLGFHLEGAATAPGAGIPTTVVARPLVLTAPTVPGESTTSTQDDDASGPAGDDPMGSTTAVATTVSGGGSNPQATTTQAEAPTTSSSDQSTTTSAGTASTSTSDAQPTTTEPATTQPTTTQPTTTQPTSTQPPTTESGAS